MEPLAHPICCCECNGVVEKLPDEERLNGEPWFGLVGPARYAMRCTLEVLMCKRSGFG